MCDIDKGPIAGVAIQLHGISLPWQSKVRSHPLASGKVVAGDKQVETAVVIVIPEPGWEAPLRFLDAEPGRDFLKRTVTFVAEKLAWCVLVSDVEIDPAIIVVISPAGGMSRVVHTQKTN